MALKTTWDSSDTTNRNVIKDLEVTYSVEQVEYEIAAKGDPEQEPEYVTEAKEDVVDAAEALADKQEEVDAAKTSLDSYTTAKNTAYSTWLSNQTFNNRKAYMTACTTESTARSNYCTKLAEKSTLSRELKAAEAALNTAEEQWATERESIYYQGGKLIGFVYHRYATLRYKYFGFSREAATSCRNALRSLYTRTFTKSATFVDGEVVKLTQTSCPSTIEASQEEGNNYSVEVDITEDDVNASVTLVEPSTLFTTENARVYWPENAN